MAPNPQPRAAFEPLASPYRPDPAILALGDQFYDAVAPADFPAAILRFRNDRWARAVGLDGLDDGAWIGHFARFRPLSGNLQRPLALRYHGHQFRVYNPDIGDGRGFLFAQLRDGHGRLLDLGTKGSGQTPWSRFGDGRLTLKGGIREVLATEMLEALGVNTSKSFSLIETGEQLHRGDEPSPTRSAVLVRLSHSHIRIGTFQRLAFHDDRDAMARLVDYVLRNLFDEEPGDDAPIRLLDLVVDQTARMAGQIMAAGFVHGVLNSDNINVTGESFDYGPWRFLPEWDGGFTAAYFDHGGLYAFARQGEAIHWDVGQLAASLRLLSGSDPLIAALAHFPARCRKAYLNAMLWRLGVRPRGEANDAALVRAIEGALQATHMPPARFFHDWFGGAPPPAAPAAFAPVIAALADYAPRAGRDAPFWQEPPCDLLIDEVEAIWAAIDTADDWNPFDAKIAQIRALGAALA